MTLKAMYFYCSYSDANFVLISDSSSLNFHLIIFCFWMKFHLINFCFWMWFHSIFLGFSGRSHLIISCSLRLLLSIAVKSERIQFIFMSSKQVEKVATLTILGLNFFCFLLIPSDCELIIPQLPHRLQY
jgi:hypothetical protein